MSFLAKKQGFLIKLPKGVDQKAGMMTFEGVTLRYPTWIKSAAMVFLILHLPMTLPNDNGQ